MTKHQLITFTTKLLFKKLIFHSFHELVIKLEKIITHVLIIITEQVWLYVIIVRVEAWITHAKLNTAINTILGNHLLPPPPYLSFIDINSTSYSHVLSLSNSPSFSLTLSHTHSLYFTISSLTFSLSFQIYILLSLSLSLYKSV